MIFSNVVGIDGGINFIAATYDSKRKSTFVNGRAVKQKRAHYKKLRQQLQKVQTPSSRRRLKAIGNRENRWMHDVNHCVQKALVEQNPKNTLFVLEDLTGVRGATEKIRVKDRYISLTTGFLLFQFEIFPVYRNASKCSKYGGYAAQGGGANNIE